MLMFVFGFLACWFVMGGVARLAAAANWDGKRLAWVLSLPYTAVALAIVTPLALLWRLLYGPWRLVLHPVGPGQLAVLRNRLEGKCLPMGKKMFLCCTRRAGRAPWRLFFVRVREG